MSSAKSLLMFYFKSIPLSSHLLMCLLHLWSMPLPVSQLHTHWLKCYVMLCWGMWEQERDVSWSSQEQRHSWPFQDSSRSRKNTTKSASWIFLSPTSGWEFSGRKSTFIALQQDCGVYVRLKRTVSNQRLNLQLWDNLYWYFPLVFLIFKQATYLSVVSEAY